MSYNISGVSSTPPVGSIIVYAGKTSPSGWLLCDGSSYSTSTYSSLYSIISYTYGGSGGSFTVPDLRSKFVRGTANTATITGTTNGANTVTLSTTNLPSHSHNYKDAYWADGGPGGNVQGNGQNGDTDNKFYWRTANGGWQANDPGDNLTTSSTGSGTSFSIIPSNLEMNFIIKY